MKFETKQSNLHHKIYSHLIKIIPIQNHQRTKLSQYLTFSIYCFDYLLILYVMLIAQWQIFNIQYTSLSILLINVIRTAINLSYIITKFKIFVFLQRVCLGVHFLFCDRGQMKNYVALFVLDIVATGIWILTTQQRNTHFNSRLFLKYSLIKQFKIQIFSLLFILLKYNTKFNPMLFVFFSSVLLFIDFYDYIYHQKFKRMLIILDLYFVFVAFLPIVFGTLDMVYDMKRCFVINGINLAAVCLYIYLSPLDFSMLFTIKPWTHNIQKHQILNYIIWLDQLITNQNQHSIFNFIIHHIKNCKQSDCFLKYQHKIKQNHKKQTQILKIFKRQILLKFLKKYKILNQYLIFNYQNNYQKAIAQHDDRNFFHFRENQKYFSNLDLRTGKTKKITTQFINQLNLIPKITEFVDIAYGFWSQLLDYKINGSKIIKLGLRQLKIIKQIQQVVKKGYILTERSRIITNICLTYLINKKQNIACQISTIHRVQNNFLGYDEAPPTLLISAQKQNFLKFTNANLAAVKISGYTRQQILSLTVDALWHKQIRQDHIVLAQKRARCNRQGSGQLIHSYVYIKNKFGYAVVLDAIVYDYDSSEGKSWCVAMQTYLDNQAVLIFNFNRQLVGMTQNCLAYGFRKDLQGQKITDDLFQTSLNSKSGVKIKNRRLFQGKQVHLTKMFTYDYILKYQTKIYFMGRPTYYVFTVNKVRGKRFSQQDTVNAIKLSYSGNKMLLKQIQKLSTTQLQLPNNFQFNYQIMKNKYIGGFGIKDRYHQQNYTKISNVLCGDTSMDKSEPQMQNMPFQYTDDIIQMRYWDGNIDFIQNLQAVIPAFQSLPQYKFKQTQLSQNQIKQNYQTRISKNSTNIKLIRVYGCILLLIVCSLLIYINVTIKTNQDSLRYWLESQQLGLKQLTQLSTISTIVLKKYYNYDNIQLGQQLDTLISQIDDIYGTIQLTVQPLHYKIVKKTIQSYTLLQSDQIYRLLIKNYFNNPTIGINSILQHFLRYIEKGWFEVIMNDYYAFQISSAAQIRGLFVFIGVTFLLAIVLVGVYLRIVDIINSTTQQLCDIFVAISHKAIVDQVAKLQSFKDYMDYGNDLFKQQNQKQQNSDETKQQYPYPKRTVNHYQQKLPSILIILGSLCFLTTLCTFTTQQYILQKSYKQTIDLHYVSQILTIEMKSIWIRLNTVPFSNEEIYSKISQLYEKHRNLQQLSMELIKNKDLGKLGQFTIKYIYGNICKQYLGFCNQQLSQSVDNGFKSVLTSFILKAKRSINKYKNLEQFSMWSQSNTMLYIDTQYISIIDGVIQQQIKEIFTPQVENSKKMYGVYFSVFIIGLIFLLFWYRELTRRVADIVELEAILWCIPFNHLKNNWKYFRYLEKVKIIQR